MSSLQPLVLTFSFNANRTEAADFVDLVQLDLVLAQITAKINEVITAINVTLRADNTLRDATVDLRNLSDDALKNLTAMTNAAVVASR